MHEHPRRLVDDEDVGVFEQDVWTAHGLLLHGLMNHDLWKGNLDADAVELLLNGL